MSVKISNILNTLVLKGSKGGSSNDVDIHLKKILKKIEDDFKNNRLNIVLDWFHESIKKELDLKLKRLNNPHVFNKPNIALLILKTNLIHSKIIELLVERIDLLCEENTEQSKMIAVDLANTFVANLSMNRDNDELVYDQYIKVISDEMKIFTRIN